MKSVLFVIPFFFVEIKSINFDNIGAGDTPNLKKTLSIGKNK